MLISRCGGLVMPAHELGGLHEHAAGAAGRVEDGAVIRLDHLDDEPHDGSRREILAALLHERGGELAHEVLEHEAVGVALDLQRREEAQQLLEHVVRQAGVALREGAGEIGVGIRDALHGRVQFGPEVRRARQRQQPREARVVRQEDRAASLIVGWRGLQAPLELGRQFGVDRLELGLHLPQRDERQHGLGVLVRTKGAVGPQLIGGGEQRREKSCRSVTTMPSASP